MELSEIWVQTVIDREMKDVELVAMEMTADRRRRVVRLFIDHPRGVGHELCARVSFVVGEALDREELIDGPYVLEVSSPGVERPLTKHKHFEAHAGKKVWVKTVPPVHGSSVWQGTLLRVVGDSLLLDDGSQEVTIPLAHVAAAHLVFDFKQGGRG